LYTNYVVRDSRVETASQSIATRAENSTKKIEPPKLAYVFYATNDNYACSALINVAILQNITGKDVKKDYVLIYTPGVSKDMVNRFKAKSVKTIWKMSLHAVGNSYYSDVLTKMYVFNMTQYERVIFLDSDILVKKSLDHLFHLPKVDLAAPRAYWLPQPFLASILLVVKPSRKLMARFDKYIKHPTSNMFDMDMINLEFINECLLLPNDYSRLNSEWDLSDGIHKFDYGVSLEEMYANAYIIHFSDLGKPWSFTPEASQSLRPSATNMFHDLYGQWRNMSGVCETSVNVTDI